MTTPRLRPNQNLPDILCGTIHRVDRSRNETKYNTTSKRTKKHTKTMYRLAALLLVVISAAQVNAQQCDRYVGRVLFLLDQSESARTNSTSNSNLPENQRYDILRDQLRQFASGLTNRPGSDVQIGIIPYTGTSRTSQQYVSPTVLANSLNRFNTQGVIPDSSIPAGGSWTYTGLTEANNNQNVQPGYRNIIVVVAAQGSFNSNRRNLARDAANALRSKGFEVFVLAVKADNQLSLLDQQEMRLVAGLGSNQQDTARYDRIESYEGLAPKLNTEIRDKRLCQTVVTPAPVITTTTPQPTTTRDPNHPCARCTHHSGTYNVPHPDTCSKYYQCDGVNAATGDYIFYVFDCGPGTLFNESTANCIWPKDFSCPAWGGMCTADRPLQRFEHLCCGKYWQCERGVVTEVDCPAGQVFRAGACRTVPDDSCLDRTPCPGRQENRDCPLEAIPSNPCQFKFRVRSDDDIQNCPPGIGFNAVTCGCHDRDVVCPTEAGVDVLNGNDEVECKAHVHITFDTTNFTVYNDTSRSVNSKVVAARNGVQWRSQNGDGYAMFGGMEGRENDIVFLPYYANRDLPDKFAMRLQFRFSQNANENEYVLIANDRCAECVATLRVTARRSSGNQWVFTFWVRDANRDEASISTTVSINDNQRWSEVKVVVDGTQISGTVSTPGSPGQANQAVMSGADNTITAKVMKTFCGISIGQGRIGPESGSQIVALDGDVNDFKFYECQDLTNLA